MHRALIATTLLFASLIASTGANAAEIGGLELHAIEVNIVAKTNAQRERYGLRPLKITKNLVQSARNHTAWMVRSRALQHTTAPVAENIAMGQRSSTEAVSSWMSSPGHRANILNASYTRIGVSAYRTPDGTIFWCQQFLQ
ncbi:MAG: CAP domain-containing protein [Pirellulales bacterium]